MAKRTTESWEALLDGTTEGPWGWRWDEGLLAIVGPDEEAIAIDADIKNSDLIAAAPEAAAEVVRLRREFEQLRDHARDVRGHESTAADITRILEGGNDE